MCDHLRRETAIGAVIVVPKAQTIHRGKASPNQGLSEGLCRTFSLPAAIAKADRYGDALVIYSMNKAMRC